jgi:DNA-binding winged helix-turn-helix (wHTH) protein/tetratricopeptide (TPR) repeat protein
MRTLAFLARNHNEVVSKDRLVEAVWGHTSVSDAALTRCIFEIRQAFGDNAKESKIVETIPKVGYRLVAPLRIVQKRSRRSLPTLVSSVAATIIVGTLVVLGTRTEEDGASHGDEAHLPTGNTLAYGAYQKGMAHYEKNAYLSNENAIALFEIALEHDPKFGLAYARLSDSLTRKIRFWDGDRLTDAGIAAGKALEFSPLRPQSHNAHGMFLALSGKDREALDSFRRAYTLDPSHWESAYNAATLQKQLLDFKEAEDLFLQVLEHSPEQVTAMGHLGFLYLRMGKTDAANLWLDRAIDQAPLEAYAWSQMAALEMVAGNTTKAIENCEKVVRLFPDYKACLHVLGVSNLMAGNTVEARAWFDYVTANLPDSRYAQLGKAQILLSDGKRDRGMAIISKVLEQTNGEIAENNYSWDEYWILAACYALQGDKSGAFASLDKAAKGGRRFYLWDSIDPVFTSLHDDQRFDRYIAMTREDSL